MTAIDPVGLPRPPSVGAAWLAPVGMAVAAAPWWRHLRGFLGAA